MNEQEDGDEGMPETSAVSRSLLLEVYNQDLKCMTAAASERGTIAARLKGLQESHGLNLKAYRIAKSIRKEPNGRREQLYRAVMNYCDLLDVNQQKDIEDVIYENNAGKVRTDMEAALDGQPRERSSINPDRPDAGSVGSSLYTPNSPMGRHTLDAFKTALDEAMDHGSVNTGLERFSRDHPKLADEALVIARGRITRIDIDAGGGEDLRGSAAREAGSVSAEQLVKAVKDETRQAKAAARKNVTKPPRPEQPEPEPAPKGKARNKPTPKPKADDAPKAPRRRKAAGQGAALH